MGRSSTGKNHITGGIAFISLRAKPYGERMGGDRREEREKETREGGGGEKETREGGGEEERGVGERERSGRKRQERGGGGGGERDKRGGGERDRER